MSSAFGGTQEGLSSATPGPRATSQRATLLGPRAREVRSRSLQPRRELVRASAGGWPRLDGRHGDEFQSAPVTCRGRSNPCHAGRLHREDRLLVITRRARRRSGRPARSERHHHPPGGHQVSRILSSSEPTGHRAPPPSSTEEVGGPLATRPSPGSADRQVLAHGRTPSCLEGTTRRLPATARAGDRNFASASTMHFIADRRPAYKVPFRVCRRRGDRHLLHAGARTRSRANRCAARRARRRRRHPERGRQLHDAASASGSRARSDQWSRQGDGERVGIGICSGGAILADPQPRTAVPRIPASASGVSM